MPLYNPSASGGSAEWGGIAGNIAAQTDLASTLDNKCPYVHGHGIADVSGLQLALNGKQAAGSYAALAHPHSIADVTGLQTALDSKANVGSGSSAAAKGVHATQPNVAAGQFLTPQLTALALTTIAAAANRLDYLPFIPAQDVTIDRLDVEVSTLIAAAQARLAIYADNAGAPGALLRDGTSVLDCSTQGLKIATITSLTMAAGTTYWLAILSSSTQTYRGVAVGALMPMLVSATLNATYVHKRQTQTFASGMPANASGLTNISGTFPLIKMRVA